MQIPDDIAKIVIALEDKYFDLKGLSVYSAVSVGSLRDYVKTGLPHFKLKGKILIRKSEFDAWLERYRVNRSHDINNIANEVMDSLKG